MKSRSKQILKTKDFDALLVQAIDEVFSCLGESSKSTIYFFLEVNFGINKEEIPNHIEDFSDALEKMFGLSAKYFEVAFIKRFYKKQKGVLKLAELNMSAFDLTFPAYVKLKRKGCEDSEDNCEMGTLMDETEQSE